MYSVLMAVDANEERAIRQAKTVASLPGGSESKKVNLLYVFGESDRNVPAEFKSVTRVASVRRAREFFEERGIEVEILEDSGNKAKDIIETAEELDVDCIVLGGRKRSPAQKALLGSVSQSVILDTHRPVIITG